MECNAWLYRNCLLEGRMRHKTFQDIYFSMQCSVDRFAGMLAGSEKWMILISIRDPDHWKYVLRARLWSPDPTLASDSEAAANQRRPRTASTNKRPQRTAGQSEAAKYETGNRSWQIERVIRRHNFQQRKTAENTWSIYIPSQVSRIELERNKGCHNSSSCSQTTVRRDF